MTDPLKDLKRSWDRLEAPPIPESGREATEPTPELVFEFRRAWRALEAPPPPRPRTAGLRPWLRVAAVVAFLLLGAGPWLAPHRTPVAPTTPAGRPHGETAAGAEASPPRMHRARLTDTGIELNSGPVRLIYVTSRLDS
ncbi:MAG TPA: hypothetical protein ENK43_15505 [Planctomycetes bacterium]|nr:hypothetical protein [Planctomycetota bacterium]